MRSLALIGSCTLALLHASAPAVAAREPITGKLSKPSYTVIAFASNGKAKSAPARRSRFSVRPPAKRVTLHLRAPNGTYAGPVVVGRKKNGRRAILGIMAGARLGEIKVRRGFAKVGSELDERRVDAKRVARSRRGVPIGAGRFGRVRSKPLRATVVGDLDADGIPDPLDVDDDGDLILDNLDQANRGSGARAAQTEGGCGPNGFYCPAVSSYLALANFAQTVNVNAGSTTGQIDATLSSTGYLRFSPAAESAELDCGGEPDPGNPDGWIGGLTYCTRGGTGVASAGGPGPAFPGPAGGEFDPDSDGFGTFPKPSFLAHRATTTQIKTGDVLTQRITSGATESEIVVTLNYVFVTIPALVSYSDTAGNSATVSYPVAADGRGTFGHGFPVSAPPGEDIVLTLTFWRPQRKAIPGSDPAGAEWMDIGHLTYAVGAPPSAGGGCPQNTFSSTDPNLVPPSLPLLGFGGLADSKDDAQASQQNTFTYQLNLSQCLAAKGLSFDPGQEQMLNFLAVAGATDTAQQTVSFKRE